MSVDDYLNADGQLVIDGIELHPCCLEDARGPHGDCQTADLIPSGTEGWPAIHFDVRSER